MRTSLVDADSAKEARYPPLSSFITEVTQTIRHNSETMRRPNYNMPKNDFSGSMRPGSRFRMHSQSKPGQIPKRIYLCRLLGTFVVLLSCFTMWQHLNLKKYHHVRQLRSNLRLLPLLKPHVIDIINDKYKYGRPSDILGENGLLIHMAHSMGNRGMDVWSNKPGAGSAQHLSCSIINIHNPHIFPQGNPSFETHEMPHSPVGYILEDANTPHQCVSPLDGRTSNYSMKDSEWSGCACLGDNPSKVPKARCMMPSTQLKEMMEKSSTGHYAKTYNEVVISKQYWKETSPSGQAILAFFYIKGSPAREEVVASHKNYLRYTHQTSSQTPLLEYDATNKQQPFIEVENE